MTERIEAWRCIGCGRVEAPANCIGVCEDRKVELVDARSYDALERELERERAANARLTALVRRLAWSTPRPDSWERSYRALQGEARALLEEERSRERSGEPPAPVVRLDA